MLGEHEAQFIEPKGDVIRAFLPKDRPAIILIDEVINYVSTYRSLGYHNRMYNFLQALSETARGQDNVVLVVSIPASELEYTAEDEADEQRFKKMLDRVGKAIMMSAETETAEIIRRRLFEWDSPAVTQDGRIILNREARDTCRAYADWVLEHRLQLPSWFPADAAHEAFLATYPFHPTVLSVFERKWQVLPRFQRTRGVLRLLALWVARAYQSGLPGTSTKTRCWASARRRWTTPCSARRSSSSWARGGWKGRSPPTSAAGANRMPPGWTTRRWRRSAAAGCTGRPRPRSSSSPTAGSSAAQPPRPKSAWPWPRPTWTSATSSRCWKGCAARATS